MDSGVSKRARVCRACDNCRKRKVKCSGATVCAECQRFNIQCVYREHYRTRKGFAIKIFQTPGFEKESTRSGTDSNRTNVKNEGDNSTGNGIQMVTQEFVRPETEYLSPASPAMSSGNSERAVSSTPPVSYTFSHDESDSTVDNKSAVMDHFDQSLDQFLVDCRSLSFLQKLHYLLGRTIFPHKVSAQAGSNIHYVSECLDASPVLCSPPDDNGTLLDGRSPTGLTEEQMLQCCSDYFNSFHIIFPMLDPDTWIRRAKSAWRTMEYTGDRPQDMKEIELAIVYMIIALGSSGSFSATFSGSQDRAQSSFYHNKALELIPSPIDAEPSIGHVQYLILLSVFRISQMKYRQSFVYINATARYALLLGLHLLEQNNLKTDEDFDAYRTWVCVNIIERYWSFCIGTPSSLDSNIPFPNPIPIAFMNNSVYCMGMGQIFVRCRYVDLSNTTMSCLHAGPSSEQGIQAVYRRALDTEHLSDSIIKSTTDEYLRSEVALPHWSDRQVKEWYWIRLFYYMNIVCIYRPFFVVSTYLNLSHHNVGPDVPPGLVDLFTDGAEKCLKASLAFYPIVSGIHRRLERCQINWFTNTYLETAGAIQFLYIISRSAMGIDHVPRDILNRFSESCAHLNGANSEVSPITPEFRHAMGALMEDASVLSYLSTKKRQLLLAFMSFKLLGPNEKVTMPEFSPSRKLSVQDICHCWETAVRLFGYNGPWCR